MAHIEIVGAMCLQLSENADPEEIKAAGFDSYFVDHGTGVYPCSASGVPFNAACLASKGDPITDLNEDLAAEQKARTTYEYLMKMTDDPDVLEPLKFLREREIVHYQRFGEALRIVQDKLNSNDFFYMRPNRSKDCNKPSGRPIDMDKNMKDCTPMNDNRKDNMPMNDSKKDSMKDCMPKCR